MFLSTLLIDVGDNPDRPRPGRLWLRNIYHVHQRLCMAFPSDPRKQQDPDFLQPFVPEDFGKGHVAVERTADRGFLFRIDHMPQPDPAIYYREKEQRPPLPPLRYEHAPGGRVVILVQSAAKPDWEYAFHNAGHFLAAKVQRLPFEPTFCAGESYRFRIRANPIGYVTFPKGDDGKSPRGKRSVIRVNAPPGASEEEREDARRRTHELQVSWLRRRLQGAAEIQSVVVEKGRFDILKRALKSKQGTPERNNFPTCSEEYRAKEQWIPQDGVLFNGVLRVTDPEKLLQVVRAGIGPGKAFGFGLLSIVRVRHEESSGTPTV